MVAGGRGGPPDGVLQLQVGGLQPSGKTPGPQRLWVPQPGQPTTTDTVVMYPPIPAGLSREKHVARLSLKSRDNSRDHSWPSGGIHGHSGSVNGFGNGLP